MEARSLIPESIRRWRRGDDRNQAIHQIQLTVDAAVDHMDKCVEIRKYLEEAKPGIDNLKETYSDCSQTVARLEAITDRIDLVLQPPCPERALSIHTG